MKIFLTAEELELVKAHIESTGDGGIGWTNVIVKSTDIYPIDWTGLNEMHGAFLDYDSDNVEWIRKLVNTTL